MISVRPSPSAWAASLLSILLLWAPLPFGSVTPSAALVLRLGGLAALALAALSEDARAGARAVAAPAGALIGLALLAFLQAVPMPAALAALLSPEHRRLAQQAIALAGSGDSEVLSLSLAPSQSIAMGLDLLALAATLVAAAIVGRRRYRRWLLVALVAAALFQLLYGLRHLAARSGLVWGLEVGRALDRLRGTFVNSAHVALYLEIALAVVFAAGWWAVRHVGDEDERVERRLLIAATPALVWLALFSGLALTRSRAGLAAAVLATVLQGALLAARGRRWRLLPIGAVAAAAGVALVAWTGLEQGLGRLLGTSAYSITASARVEVWGATAELWRRFPLSGTGLGTFEEAFSMVEPPGVRAVSWQHAHNDWLELLATGGLVAATIGIFGLTFLALRLRRVLLGSRRTESVAAAVAACGALSAVAFHELFDFGLTLPASAFTLAVLVGAAAAAHDELPAAWPGGAHSSDSAQ